MSRMVNVFPQAFTIHRGVSTDDEIRSGGYMQMCLNTEYDRIINDKLETSEFAPGFLSGSLPVDELKFWLDLKEPHQPEKFGADKEKSFQCECHKFINDVKQEEFHAETHILLCLSDVLKNARACINTD